ncbi:MAG: T9SS type A sorting domain-containing protein [Flavobacteriales bacterium]|nr:T9SS type A sorting domain-containing protein [Flavobacteriales bacterium]
MTLSAAVNAQCINASAFGTATVAAPGGNINLTTCAFGGEFSTANGLVPGNSYNITGTGGIGNYLTITDGANAVIQFGFSPQLVTGITGTIRVHVNTTAGCGTDGSCHTVNVATLLPPGPPNCATTYTPANLAVQVGLAQTLSWSGATGNPAITGYDVYFGTVTPPPLVSPAQVGLTYNPGPLACNTVYYYQVNPINANGTTVCTINSFTTLSTPACPATFTPANLATNVAQTQVLSWAASAGATGYNVFFDVVTPPVVQVATNQPGTSWTPPSLLGCNTVYYWRVEPINCAGTNTGCAINTFTTVSTPPVLCPTTLNPTNLITGVNLLPTISWSAVTGASGYDVYLDVVTPPVVQVASNTTNLFYSVNTALLPSTVYYWRIAPRNCIGANNACVIRSFTTTAAPAVPLQYDVTLGTTPMTSIAGTGTSFVFPGTSTDDNTSNAVTIPFSFIYQGVARTQFKACTNGWLTLNVAQTTTSFSNVLGASATINTVIAPFYDDMVTQGNPGTTASLNASMKYQVTGSPGSQVLTVEWINMERFGNAGPNMNFQAKLYEGSNNIEFIYGTMEAYDGTVNFNWTYSIGLNALSVTTAANGGPGAGEVIAQQVAREKNFGPQLTVTANAGANANQRVPRCGTSMLWTPGAYSGNGPAVGAPTNEAIGSAEVLPVNPSTCVTVSLCGTYRSSRLATASGYPTCGGNPDDDVWFTFTPTNGFPVSGTRITVRSYDGYDAHLEVINQALTTIGCVNATGAGLTEVFDITGLNYSLGQQYYARVYHTGVGSGTTLAPAEVAGEFGICVSDIIPPPVNDECAGAITLTSNLGCVYTAGSTIVATASAGVPACNTPDDDIWYTFTPLTNNPIITVQSGAGFNAAFQVLGGPCGTYTSLACVNSTGTGGLESSAPTLVAGTQYWIRVFHAVSGSGSGNFQICIDETPACPTLTSPADLGSTSTPTLTWNAGLRNSGYDVYLDVVTPPVAQVSSNQPGLSYVPGALIPNTTYYWQVVGRNALGAATCPTVFSFTTCDAAAATASAGVASCVLPTWDLTVTVTSMGSAASIDVSSNLEGVLGTVTTPGVYVYAMSNYGSHVITLIHDGSAGCNFTLPGTYSPSGPTCLTCGDPAIPQTFCYGPNENTTWLYQGDNPGGTALLVCASGFVESNTWDDLTIYDGPDNTDPVLYANPGATVDLTGLTIVGSTNELFMSLTSDGSVQCTSQIGWTWNWTAQCLDCDLVQANVTGSSVDCGTATYTVGVDVTDLGDSPDVDIIADYPVANTIVHNDVGLGSYTVPGIPVGTPVNIVVQHNGSLICSEILPTQNPSSNCIVCDNSVFNEGPFCYGPNANQTWSYTSDGNGTMLLTFSSGSIESNTWDDLTIYDGPDNTFPILFANPASTINLAGVQVQATGNELFMTLTADASVQCTSNVGWDWNWGVQCVDCTFPAATGTVIEDCGNSQFSISVNVTDDSNANAVDITTDYLGDTEPTGVGLGTYVIGPYPIGTVVNVQVEHPTNAFCTLDLGLFSDCCNGACATAATAVIGNNFNGEYNCGTPVDLFINGIPPTDARWWNFTPLVNEKITIGACTPPNSTNTDTYLTVSTGPCGAQVLHGGDDDGCVTPGFGSTYTFKGDVGTEYHIQWDDRWGDDAAHDWNLAVTPCVSPANDLCSSENPAASPVSIGSPQTFNGVRDCANKDGIVNPLTFPTIAGWVWESFELTQCANITIDYCGTAGGTGNAALNMYGDCGTLFINSQTFAFNCDLNTNATITFADLSPGFYYYPVLWDPVNLAEGAYTITVTAFAPTNPCPTNLTCATAILMVCNDILLGNTNNQFPTLPANACAYPNSPISGGSLWYSYTPVVNENVVVSTCGAGTLFDTRLDVYTGTCGSLTCYNLSDDKGGACTTRSQLEFYAQAGQTYYIAVHSATPFIDCQFEIAIGCGAACVPPANDVCGSAIGLTTYLTDNTTFFPGVPTAGDNGCAQNDPFTSCSLLANNQGMWYSFNSGTNTIHYLTLNTFDQDPLLTSTVMNYTLYSGGCNGMQGVAQGTCVLNGDGDYLLLPSLTTGTNYLLYLYNQGDAGFEGTFEVLMEHPGMNDAGIIGVNDPVGLICTSTITPEVVLKNYGENPLTSVTITYDLDGLTGPFVFNWTGNLPFLGSEVVTLPSFTAPYGSHTFNVSTSAPNSQVDEIPTNDADVELNVDVTGETMIVEITTDNDPSQLIWQIYDQGNQLVGVSPVYATPNITDPTTLCLSTLNGTCFNFFLFDFLGDGLSQTGNGSGSWRLRTTGGATLLGDDFDGTVDGTFSPTVSPLSGWYTNGHPFCLPAGPTEPLPSECGIFTNNLQSKVYCKALPGVTNYQFQFLRPDEGYSRQISVPRNWVKFGEMQTFPLQPGETYFCRVRADQAPFGNYSTDKYGTGCEMGIDPSLVPGCTGLVDDIGAPAHSCGVIKVFGGSQKIWAQPVLGATQYRFRFQNGLIDPDGPNLPGAPALGTRIITVSSYALVLSWTNFTLVNGSTYDVTVEVLVAGQWSGYCGPVCQVEIDNTPGQSLRGMEASTSSDLQVWPNPVRDGQVNVLIGGLTDDTQRITLDVFDIYGKRVMAFDKENSGSVFNTILDMDGIAAGVYMVSVTVNDRVYQQRVSVL